MTPNVIYVDCDDTLIRSFGSKRIPMTQVVDKVKALKLAGATLYCWSSGGGEYAHNTCVELGIAECFESFLPKPGLIVDDFWKATVLHPNEWSSQ